MLTMSKPATFRGVSVREDFNPRVKEDVLESRRNELYAREVRQGYRWVVNAPVERRNGEKTASEKEEHYRSTGFDVLLHDQAIDFHGWVMPGYKAVLIKSKSRQKS